MTLEDVQTHFKAPYLQDDEGLDDVSDEEEDLEDDEEDEYLSEIGDGGVEQEDEE